MEENYFTKLNNINVNEKTEKKNGLTYLSWAWSWGEVKKLYPDANYVIYERETEFGPVNYFTDGRTCWVKTGVIINGIEHIEELPVMDFKNKSIPLEVLTSFDINKTIQRSLTKAVARHGLGLYIFAGEDLPEEEASKEPKKTNESEKEKLELIDKIYKFESKGVDIDAVAKFYGSDAIDNLTITKLKEALKTLEKKYGV